LGQGPKPGRLAFSPRSALRPETAVGRWFPWAGPLAERKKISFGFLLCFGKENALEKYCVPFLAPKILKQIL
jgi:hypothetical protein